MKDLIEIVTTLSLIALGIIIMVLVWAIAVAGPIILIIWVVWKLFFN